MTRDQILATLAEYLTEMFDVPPEKISLEAKLFEELDLDSIDAVDLVVKLQTLTGQRIRPEEFKSVRTVGDVVVCVEELLAANASVAS